MKLIAIARASTTEQEQSIKIQLEQIKNWAFAMGHEIVTELTALESGKHKRRPTVEEALALVQAGKANGIVVTKLDRLGRNLGELCRIVETLDELRAAFVCTEHMIDTSTPQGILFFQVMGAIAQFERSLILGRVTTGIEAAIKENRLVGRCPFGFNVIEGILVPVEHEQITIQRMKVAKETGQSAADIAKWLNAEKIQTKYGSRWNRQLVENVLKKDAARQLVKETA